METFKVPSAWVENEYVSIKASSWDEAVKKYCDGEKKVNDALKYILDYYHDVEIDYYLQLKEGNKVTNHEWHYAKTLNKFLSRLDSEDI